MNLSDLLGIQAQYPGQNIKLLIHEFGGSDYGGTIMTATEDDLFVGHVVFAEKDGIIILGGTILTPQLLRFWVEPPASPRPAIAVGDLVVALADGCRREAARFEKGVPNSAYNRREFAPYIKQLEAADAAKGKKA